jgi:hypothetical protein
MDEKAVLSSGLVDLTTDGGGSGVSSLAKSSWGSKQNSKNYKKNLIHIPCYWLFRAPVFGDQIIWTQLYWINWLSFWRMEACSLL